MDGQTVYQNICCQNTYKEMSQEELRLADYRHGHRHGSIFGAGASGFGGSVDFGTGAQGFGAIVGQRSFSLPEQGFGTTSQTHGSFGFGTGSSGGFGATSSTPFNRFGTVGGFQPSGSQQGQATAPFGSQLGPFNFSILNQQQPGRPSMGDTSKSFPFSSGPQFGQISNPGFSFSTSQPPSGGSLFSRISASSHPGFPSVSGSWSQSPQQSQQWQLGQSQAPAPGAGTNLFGGGFGRSVSTDAALQTASPQMTTRIDDITAYGAPWLFADEQQHQPLHGEGPLAVRLTDERPRRQSMSPGFKYTGPVFAGRQMSPSSFGFRYTSRTTPESGRSRSNSSG